MDRLPVDRMSPEELLAPYPPSRIAAAEELRRLVRRAVPSAIEAVRPGWRLIGYDLAVGRRSAFFAFVWPEIEHVHLGFEHGALLDDPRGVLRGHDLKKVRFVTVADLADIDRPAFEGLVREAARIAALSREERFALRHERGLVSPAGGVG